MTSREQSETLKIFREMRKEAIDSILASGCDKLEVDQIKWIVLEDGLFDGIHLELSFFVNGKPQRKSISINRLNVTAAGFGEDQCAEIERQVVDVVSNVVEQVITRDLFETLGPTLSRKLVR